MLVLGINYEGPWVQITTNGARYTCPMKDVDGELFFKFKNEWHSVVEFASDTLKEEGYRGLGYDDFYQSD